MATKKPNKKPSVVKQVMNTLSGLASGFYGQAEQKALVQTTPLQVNLRRYLISNDRNTLAYLYVEQGLIQTLVDQPVEDAFRAGFNIKTSQLNQDEIDKLYRHMVQNEVIKAVMQTVMWGRLYGGGSLMVVTDQDPATPFNPATLKEHSRIKFVATDMWELYNQTADANAYGITLDSPLEKGNYSYYGIPVHNSRVLPFRGKEAPSFIRGQLRGWGMSEVERVVSPLNQYMMNNNVIYELLSEAKIDVYKVDGLNSALATDAGTSGIFSRLQSANLIKNYQNALVMDTQDDYIQKTMTFAGLSEVLTQIRQGIASDLKMPITKLFGVSSAGFNSGEDDIENYNSMIESQIRQKVESILMKVIQILSQKMFGIYLDDLEIEWGALRVLNAEQEENVKTQVLNRTLMVFRDGLMSAKETKMAINKDNLVPIAIQENDEILETGLDNSESETALIADDSTSKQNPPNAKEDL